MVVSVSVPSNSLQEISDLLTALRRRGVRLWSRNGELHYQAPKGAVTPGELSRLKTHKFEITRILEQAGQSDLVEPALEPQLRSGAVPLAHTQVAYWNEQRLSERRGRRALTATFRLLGRLRLEIFQRCMTELVLRHEALRTQIRVDEGSPLQEVESAKDFLPVVYDLRQLPSSERESEARRLMKKHREEMIDVTQDPLFAVWLLRVSDEDQILIVAMHHLISDGTSRDILFRDFCLVYSQLSRGVSIDLPQVGVQLSDFALWQRRAEPVWRSRSGAYWESHLLSSPLLFFPRDVCVSAPEVCRIGSVWLKIDGDRLSQLRGLCKTSQTTLTMGLMAAYAGFVLRWCGSREGIIQYEINGRTTPGLDNTIGYFAFPLYLNVKLYDQDVFADLVKRMVDAYCLAYEHRDFAMLKAYTPQPGLVRSPLFNCMVHSHGTDKFAIETSDGQLIATPIRLERNEWEGEEMEEEPGLYMLEFSDRIHGVVSFPLHRFSFQRMQVFARELVHFIYELLDRPQCPVESIPIRLMD
jgi:hypothetical protein